MFTIICANLIVFVRFVDDFGDLSVAENELFFDALVGPVGLMFELAKFKPTKKNQISDYILNAQL
jgi:hypothetical protein